MFLKKWPYWLRGGVVPLTALTLAYILGWIIEIFGLISHIRFLALTGYLLLAFLSIVNIFGGGVVEIFIANPRSTLGETPIMVITIIMLFGLGSLIGLIYGKLKKK